MEHPLDLNALEGLTKQERRLVWLAFAWIFVTIAAYTMIGAVRAGMLLWRFSEAVLPWTFMASAAVTGAAVWAYNVFARRLSRRALVRGALAALAASLAAWAVVVALTRAAGWAAFAFSLWSDVFGIMSVTLFWSYVDDIFSTAEAKKVYGLIAAAGPLGSVLGSLLTMEGAMPLGLSPLLWIAFALFVLTLALHEAMERIPSAPAAARRAVERPPAGATAAGTRPSPAAGVLRTIARSPFLVALAAVVFLERLVPDFSDYLFGAALHAHVHGAQAIARFQGMYSLAEGGASLLASVLLTRWILESLGVGAALMSCPLANLVGLLVFPVRPTLGWTAGYNGAEGLLRYSWFKSAKEATYTAESRDVIYRVKAFVEMFLYRFARGVAGFLLLLLTGAAFWGRGPKAVALAGVPLALLWVYAAWRMGREARAER